VLAVDQQLKAPEENKVDPKALSSVTLLVTPNQANVLDLAQNMGTLSLACGILPTWATRKSNRPRSPRSGVWPCHPQATEPPTFIDGDKPPTAEMLAMTSSPRAERREPVWIDTMRGTQRGRVAVTTR
jgi:hypothetical protein